MRLFQHLVLFNDGAVPKWEANCRLNLLCSLSLRRMAQHIRFGNMLTAAHKKLIEVLSR